MALKRIRMKTEKDGVKKKKSQYAYIFFLLKAGCQLVSYYSDERNQIITKIKA